MGETGPHRRHSPGGFGVRVDLVACVRNPFAEIAFELCEPRIVLKRIGTQGTELRLVMLGHIKTKCAQIGTWAMGVDANQVRIG